MRYTNDGIGLRLFFTDHSKTDTNLLAKPRGYEKVQKSAAMLFASKTSNTRTMLGCETSKAPQLEQVVVMGWMALLQNGQVCIHRQFTHKAVKKLQIGK
jgi:hypothetical protein